ncbi:MAG: hypothetical protein ACAI38_07795 [Myxococcota bacterium]
MTRFRLLKPLAVLPAAAVFAWIVGVIPAGGTPPPAPVTQTAIAAIDAWEVPSANHGDPDTTMAAWTELPKRVAPMSKADYQRDLENRTTMPATKSGIAFVPSSYEDHVEATARKNRLRFTRLWYSRTLDAQVPPALLSFMSAPAVACAEHTWAFAREYSVTFELSPKGTATNVASDGPPALAECFTKRLAEWKLPNNRKSKQQAGATTGKIVLSFVAVKV